MVKIMLVDDSAFMRQIIRDILEKAKYTDIVEASTGDECLELVGEAKPDIIFLDIIMPDLGGVDVLKRVKEKSPDSKIVMITSVGQDTIINECAQLGAVGYVVKPFTEKKVTEALKSALG